MHRKGRMIGFAVVTAMVLSAFGTLADGLALSVTNVVSRQRYPWNGLVDIDCEIACSDPATNINLYLSAKDNAANKSLPMRHVWLEGDTTHTNALTVKAGKHRLVWDLGVDAPNIVSPNVTIDVQAIMAGVVHYLVIDLSGGANATFYPVNYLGVEPQGGWSEKYKTEKLLLRMIPAGTFTMGSPLDEIGRLDEVELVEKGRYEVQHEVCISRPFYMGVFEVTQKQYQLVMGTNPSSYKGDMRPVEKVSWNIIRGDSSVYNWPNVTTVDPTTFIGKLRARTGINGFDLPTEAQWEYACRAGTTTALNSGKNLMDRFQDVAMDEVGRYSYNCGAGGILQNLGTKDGKGGYYDNHTTVGSYIPNNWGLYDMHGNVKEWCLDYWAKEGGDGEAVLDPVGPVSGSSRVYRGGGWNSLGSWDCRSAYNDAQGPTRSNHSIGFRLCCSAGL